MTRSYVCAYIMMLLSSVITAAPLDQEPALLDQEPASPELDDLMYQTENEIDPGPGPRFSDLPNYDRDLGSVDGKSAELLLASLMGADDQETPGLEYYGPKWDIFYKPPALHLSPKRAKAGLLEAKLMQDRLRAQAKERKRMLSSTRPRAASVQPEWNTKKGTAASRLMVCYFKVCSWRG